MTRKKEAPANGGTFTEAADTIGAQNSIAISCKQYNKKSVLLQVGL
jgi:hypothetical protein